jgi:hypothetical protein
VFYLVNASPFKKLNGFPADLQEVKKRREHVKSIIISHPKYSNIMSKIEEIHFYSQGSIQSDSLFLMEKRVLEKQPF